MRTSRKLATVDGGEHFFVTPRTWLGSARNFAKTRFRRFRAFRFSTQFFFFGKIFGLKFSFFVDLAWFSKIYGRTDVKISFLVKFCFRWTYPEVCTSKKPRIRNFCRPSNFFHLMPARIPNTFSVRDLFPQPHF